MQLAVLWACAMLPSVARAEEQETTRLGLALHVAQEEGQPVAKEDFLERQLEAANRIFAPYGIAFEIKERHQRAASHARMETRSDRNRLAPFVRPKWVNVFVVTSLRDVDDPKRMRRGVHWHSRPVPQKEAATQEPAHYIILSKISFDAVLAHELGHFLGNRRHSETPGNLMSYKHQKGVLPFLDAAQQRRLRKRLSQYLESGELIAVEPPTPAASEQTCMSRTRRVLPRDLLDHSQMRENDAM